LYSLAPYGSTKKGEAVHTCQNSGDKMSSMESLEEEIGCDVPVERCESKGVNQKINQVLDEYEEYKKRQCAEATA
jgi:hypothetical protein